MAAREIGAREQEEQKDGVVGWAWAPTRTERHGGTGQQSLSRLGVCDSLERKSKD